MQTRLTWLRAAGVSVLASGLLLVAVRLAEWLGRNVGATFEWVTLGVALLGAASLLFLTLRSRSTCASARTKEIMHRAVMESTAYSVITVDCNGIITTFNAGAETLLGYKREEVVGATTPLVFHLHSEIASRARSLSLELGRKVEQDMAVFVEPLELKEYDEHEWTYVRKDGRHVPVMLGVTLLRHEGVTLGFLGIAVDISMRAAAEASVRESERKLRASMSALSSGIVIQDTSGRILEWNPEAERILGLNGDQLAGRQSVDPRWHAIREDGSEFPGSQHPAMVTLSTGRAQNDVIMGLQKPDGTVTWISINSRPILNTGGSVTAVVCNFLDVTQRRLVEEKLDAGRKRIEVACDVASFGIWEWDAITNRLDWDPTMRKIYGVVNPVETPTYAYWLEKVVPEDRHDQDFALQALLRTGKHGHREFRIRRENDGAIRSLISSETVLVDAAGRPTRVIGCNIDVTDRKEAEMAARESEERFRQAFEFTGIGMALVDQSSRWLKVNPALCRILEYSAEELQRLTCNDVTHPEDLSFCPDAMSRLTKGLASFCQVEKRYLKKSGEIVWAQVSLSLVRDTAGHTLYFVAQIEDISRRRELDLNLAKARDQALETSRLKSEFLASMSHEIRTPMNAVIGMARLIKETPLDEEQQKMNDVLLASAEALLGLLNDVLDFSKIEAGRMRFELEDYNLVDIVNQSCELFSASASAKGLVLRVSFQPDFPAHHRGDAGRVRQVLTNLIGNAVKFTQRGQVNVDVGHLKQGGRALIRIEVSDTGIGIPSSAMPRLFQTFTQLDGGTTRRHGGTGLGLAICKQLVELMGGRIGVTSVPDEGSVFWFELPTSVQPQRVGRSVALPETGSRNPLRPSGHRVLIVEDNFPNQLVMKLSLKKRGCAVSVANNGQEALGHLASGRFDVVIMDCQMPELDGYETTRLIRNGAIPTVSPNIPIIAVTAFAMAGDRERCLNAGMTDYIPKPVHEGALAEAFKRCGYPLD